MRDSDLFPMALGLEASWHVDRTEFEAERKRFDLYLEFCKEDRFTCPECVKGRCPAHDTSEKS